MEALFDVARHLLSKAHGRGALEYKEVARLTGEKGLLNDPELESRFVEIAGFRNRLIHYYHEVTPEELYEVTTGGMADLEALKEALRAAAALLATTEEDSPDAAQ